LTATVALGDLTLDLAQGRLIGPEGDIALRAKSFALLTYLVQHQGRVLTKDDLMAAVWPDVTVTDESLTQCVHDLRRALGANGAGLLRTVPRRGYVLDHGEVTIARGVVPGSLAVLPFRLDGAVGAEEHLLFEGLAHDVIGRLARLRSFHVIGRGSSFAMRHLADHPQDLGRALNVAYAITGRAVRRGARFRLHVDLLDCAHGGLIWSEAFDIAATDIMQAADTLPDPIAAAVAREITQSEMQRVAILPENLPLDAWQKFHLGLRMIFAPTDAPLGAVLRCFTEATDLSPGFARAHAFQSFCHFNQATLAAQASAREAVLRDATSPVSQWALGRAWWLRRDPACALHHMRHALTLCPSFPQAHYMAGFIEAYQGDAAQALDDLTMAEALSPVDPLFASLQIAKGTALARLEDMTGAISTVRLALCLHDGFDHLQGHAALLLAGLGEVEEAKVIMAQAPGDYRPAALFERIYDMEGGMRRLLEAGAKALKRDLD
jgi:DNA-binding winged helix-turn-helix (wHTH) protein/TolB-like protein